MRRADFNYELPAELIAQQPLAERSASRLLTLDGATGALADRQIRELPELLADGDLLLFNDTRVVPARLYALKDSGGKVQSHIVVSVSQGNDSTGYYFRHQQGPWDPPAKTNPQTSWDLPKDYPGKNTDE